MSDTIKAELIDAGTIKGTTTITYKVSIDDLKKFSLTFYRFVMLMSYQPNCPHCGAKPKECYSAIHSYVIVRHRDCYEREIASLKAELATAKGVMDNLKKQREGWEKYRAQIMADMEKFIRRGGIV